MNKRNKHIDYSFGVIALLLIVLTIGLPFLYNLTEILGVYDYKSTKNYRFNYENGSGIVNFN